MEFKQITLERLPEIVEVNHKIFEGMYEWKPYYIDTYQEKFKGVDPVIFVAEKNGEILADSISFDRDNKWYLWIFGVLKEYRGQNIANQLFDLNEKYAREHGYKEITVKVYNVSREMLRLVIKRGYEINSVESHEKTKYNAVHLSLTL